jgi:UDP-sugar transporter A1/2/3
MTQLYSIMILSAGVACASIPSSEKQPHKASIPKLSQSSTQSHSLGVSAVSAACFISGFAGVYTESILKKTQPSAATDEQGSEDTGESKNCLLWLRNFQLSLSGLAFAAFGCFIIDQRQITRDGFWHGYTSIVWATIVLQAVGGLVVALVITYTDNILKGFATSISVIISTVVSSVIWGFKTTPLFLVGMVAVLVATYMYSLPGRSDVSKPENHAGEGVEEKAGLLEHSEGDESDGGLEKGLSRGGSESD